MRPNGIVCYMENLLLPLQILFFLSEHKPFTDDIVADQNDYLRADLHGDARQSKTVDKDQQDGFLNDQRQHSPAEKAGSLAEQFSDSVRFRVKHPQTVGDIGECYSQHP